MWKGNRGMEGAGFIKIEFICVASMQHAYVA